MPLTSTSEEQRMRLSRGSFEVHTLHEQPICGTPEDVPVPKKVILHLFRGIECSSITKAFKNKQSQKSYELYFRTQFYLKFLFNVIYYPIRQSYYFLCRSSSVINKHKRLFLVNPYMVYSSSFPSALFY